jgi:hypothetical protein
MVCTAVSAYSALTFYNGICCLGRFLLYKEDFLYSPETKRENNYCLENVYTARKITIRHYAPPTSG